MKDSTTNTAARELLDGIEGDYAVCMGVSEQSYRQFCDSGALGRMPNDTWAVHCHARKAQIDQLRALLVVPQFESGVPIWNRLKLNERRAPWPA